MNLKNIGKVFTSKFAGTGPWSYKKKNLPGRGLTKVQKRWSIRTLQQWRCVPRYSSNEEQYILTRQIPHGYRTYLFLSKTGGTVEKKRGRGLYYKLLSGRGEGNISHS